MKNILTNQLLFVVLTFLVPFLSNAQTDAGVSFFPNKSISFVGLLLTFSILIIGVVFLLILKMLTTAKYFVEAKKVAKETKFKKYFSYLSLADIELLKNKQNQFHSSKPKIILGFIALLSQETFGQIAPATRTNLFSEPGVIITTILVFIPLFFAIIYLTIKVKKGFNQFFDSQKVKEAEELAAYLLDSENIPPIENLEEMQQKLDFKLSTTALSGTEIPEDKKGLLKNISSEINYRYFATKRPAVKRPKIDPQLTTLILWFLGSAVFWLFIGSSVGEYVGIKFIAPDADTFSWLSIGRLRAVHTNLVFWAWATIGIMGLGYYIVPMVSNTSLHSVKNGWIALICVNVSMLVGGISLMAGINNGGGEYREIIWPIMAVWACGLMLTVINFIKTVAKRTTHEIYISNWFIIASYIFILIVAVIAYLPMGQEGIGETIVQGYYMHQAVGMWFMFSMLGVLYYLLPQQLNKPIYSYSLGVLAFWSQILFYTLIGTHHFVFSALPWWLQTVAIVGSVGMLIPVTAGTINYLMTFRGSWGQISNSYSLPFFFVGVIYYFTGSFQGTAEAFRSTNLIWHFTDFTIAHSHITMYGIITFLLFGSIYAIVPRLTGKEPPQFGVGAHFWLALMGLQFYTIPLMIGGTLKGLMWAEGKPFIESVVMMGPYWLWRAIGGTLMWLSHIVLAYNMYKMIKPTTDIDIKEKAFELIRLNLETNAVETKI